MVDPQATSHHVVNAAAVALPVMSWLAQAPAVMTTVTATLGAIWYVILIIGRLSDWRKRK